MLDYSIDYNYENKYLELLKEIILEKFKDTEARVFLFGSRVKKQFRRDSDYDIGVQNINKDKFVMLKWDIEYILENSIIPHTVDIINFDDADDNFKKYALKDIDIWKNY